MTKTKRQHFIPRFYLKSFGDRLFCYDKLEDRVIPTNIRSIALGKYFYEVEGLDDGLIEKFLAENETKFSRAYYELLGKKDITKLSSESQDSLFRFIAVQFLRTEQYRLQLEDITSQALTTFAKKIGRLPHSLKISYDPATIKVMHIEIILGHSRQSAQIFADKKWEIIEASGDIPL